MNATITLITVAFVRLVVINNVAKITSVALTSGLAGTTKCSCHHQEGYHS